MRFTFISAAVMAVAGLVQAQSTTSKPSSASGASAMTTAPPQSGTTINPNANNLCLGMAIQIPNCGLAALTSLGNKIGGCGPVDFICQCAVSQSVQNAASSPIIAACGLNTALVVQGAANNLCQCIFANNAPISTASGAGGGQGGAPAYVMAKPTDAAGVFSALGPAIIAGAGVLAAL